jgi:hypothetical protein
MPDNVQEPTPGLEDANLRVERLESEQAQHNQTLKVIAKLPRVTADDCASRENAQRRLAVLAFELKAATEERDRLQAWEEKRLAMVAQEDFDRRLRAKVEEMVAFAGEADARARQLIAELQALDSEAVRHYGRQIYFQGCMVLRETSGCGTALEKLGVGLTKQAEADRYREVEWRRMEAETKRRELQQQREATLHREGSGTMSAVTEALSFALPSSAVAARSFDPYSK